MVQNTHMNSMRWAKRLKSIRPDLVSFLDDYISNFDEVKDLRDMLEHEDAYEAGAGNKQSQYLKQISFNNGRITGGARPQTIFRINGRTSIGERVSVDDSLIKAQKLYADLKLN